MSYKPEYSTIELSSGETIHIHLKDLEPKNVYVSLVALKIEFSEKHRSELGKVKYYLIRYAGEKAKFDNELRPKTQPHLTWLIERAETA